MRKIILTIVACAGGAAAAGAQRGSQLSVGVEGKERTAAEMLADKTLWSAFAGEQRKAIEERAMMLAEMDRRVQEGGVGEAELEGFMERFYGQKKKIEDTTDPEYGPVLARREEFIQRTMDVSWIIDSLIQAGALNTISHEEDASEKPIIPLTREEVRKLTACQPDQRR
jgi:hypothetical protein